MNKWKKGIAAVSAAVLLSVSLGAPNPVNADAIWDMQVKAENLLNAGDTAAAVPLWETLVDQFSAEQDWESAAIYCGKLDEYFDSIKDYDNAVKYYELENDFWVKFGKDWGAPDLQRAEQLRTRVEAYISTDDAETIKSESTPKSGGLAKFEPESGMYIGLYSERDPKMQNYFTRSESFYGKNHALYLAYTPWGKPFPAAYANNAKEAGSGLQLAFEPTGGLSQIQDSTYIRGLARDAKAAGIPIFLRFASEMNGDWTDWSYPKDPTATPEKYIEKFRLVSKIMKEEAPNVAMVWSPNDVPRFSMSKFYPGDDYVDWVGISLYTEPYENGKPELPGLGASPIERLDELYSLYADRKPIMISETAVSHLTHRDNKSHSDWAAMNLERLYEIMPKKYPRLKAITYFNADLGDEESQNDYLLRDNQAIMNLYKSIIANPYYLSKIEQGAKPADGIGYVKVESSASFNKNAHIASFVKIPEVTIGKLEYVLNGDVIAAKTSAPFSLDLNAGDVPDGSIMELRVYNADGQKVAGKTFTLNSRISVQIDGKPFRPEQPPVIVDGSTYAPLRAIFEALGATVEWNDTIKTATAKKGGTTVSLQIGSSNAVKNGTAVELPDGLKAQLIGGSTMAPARFVGEVFGGKVEWDNKTRTVKITTK